MPQAKIYKPAKTAMQSGLAQTKEWRLEFLQDGARSIDPLMGYTSSRDTSGQVKLEFDTKEEAVAYAERNGIPFTLYEPQARKPVAKSYADNFKYGRIGTWTH